MHSAEIPEFLGGLGCHWLGAPCAPYAGTVQHCAAQVLSAGILCHTSAVMGMCLHTCIWSTTDPTITTNSTEIVEVSMDKHMQSPEAIIASNQPQQNSQGERNSTGYGSWRLSEECRSRPPFVWTFPLAVLLAHSQHFEVRTISAFSPNKTGARPSSPQEFLSTNPLPKSPLSHHAPPTTEKRNQTPPGIGT
jgi:hypothetical protein